MSERWLPIRGMEGFYEISDLGNVRSVSRTQIRKRKNGTKYEYPIVGRALTPRWENKRKTGLTVQLTRSIIRKVHHLVLEAFVGPRPDGQEGMHADDNPGNNTLENLSWGTHAHNMRDAVVRGRMLRGEKHPNAILSEENVLAIFQLCQSKTNAEIAPFFGVAKSTVNNIRRRVRWTHILSPGGES